MNKLKSIVSIFLLILPGVVLFFILYSYNGVGITHDSVFYIRMAQSISQGEGLFVDGKFINHWPPGYPALISFFSKILKQPPINSLIYLQIFLYYLSGLFFFILLKQLNFNSSKCKILTFVFLISFPIIHISVLAWSELAFIVILLIITNAWVYWLKSNREYYLFIAGFFSGLLFLIRFAGISFVAGFGIFLLIEFIFSNQLKSFIRNIFSYYLPFGIIFTGWNFYTKSFGNSFSDRTISIYIPSLKYIIKTSLTVLEQIFGNDETLFFLLVIFIIIYVFKARNEVYNLIFFKYIKVNERKFTILFTVLVLTYLLFIFIAKVLFDRGIPFNIRIFSVIFPLFLILISLFFKNREDLTSYALFYLILFLITLGGMERLYAFYRDGYGFNSRFYKSIDYSTIDSLFKHKKVYSPQSPAFFYLHNLINNTKSCSDKFVRIQVKKLPDSIRENIKSGQAVFLCVEGDKRGHFGIKHRFLPNVVHLFYHRELKNNKKGNYCNVKIDTSLYKHYFFGGVYIDNHK